MQSMFAGNKSTKRFFNVTYTGNHIINRTTPVTSSSRYSYTVHTLTHSVVSPTACTKPRVINPGVGNRSIFYPDSSVGSTFTFDIVEDTSSNPRFEHLF